MNNATDALAAVHAEIARVRASYLAGLPAEVHELQHLATGLTDRTPARAVFEEVHHRLHKLAGSGGTFGRAELSAHARRLESTLKDWLDNAPPASALCVDTAERHALVAEIAMLSVFLVDGNDTVSAAHRKV